MRFNSDGAFSEQSGSAAIGVIVRKSEGKFLQGIAQKVNAHSALMTEALALKEAVSFSERFRFDDAVFEIDSEELYGALSTIRKYRWEVEPVIMDIREILSRIKQSRVNLVRRSANEASNWIAVNTKMGKCP